MTDTSGPEAMPPDISHIDMPPGLTAAEYAYEPLAHDAALVDMHANMAQLVANACRSDVTPDEIRKALEQVFTMRAEAEARSHP